MRAVFLSPVLIATTLAACGETTADPGAGVNEATQAPLQICLRTEPTKGLYATFRVNKETYHQLITNPPAIEDAIALWYGKSDKRIPIGPLVCSCSTWNDPWSWYVDPDRIQFAKGAIEVCDGTPGYVQTTCRSFGNGNYCPWSAVLTNLLDCRSGRGCVPVPK